MRAKKKNLWLNGSVTHICSKCGVGATGISVFRDGTGQFNGNKCPYCRNGFEVEVVNGVIKAKDSPSEVKVERTTDPANASQS